MTTYISINDYKRATQFSGKYKREGKRRGKNRPFVWGAWQRAHTLALATHTQLYRKMNRSWLPLHDWCC